VASLYRADGAGVADVAAPGEGGVVTGRLVTGGGDTGVVDARGISEECGSTGVDGPGVDGAPGVSSGPGDSLTVVVGSSTPVVVGVVVVRVVVVGVVVVGVVVGERRSTSARGAQVYAGSGMKPGGTTSVAGTCSGGAGAG
jgi:hypothetical protein